MRGGFTLLELLVASLLIGILTLALSRAFAFGVLYQGRAEESRQRELARLRFEDKLRGLLEQATVTTDVTDNSSFFLAGTDATGAADRLTFTTSAARLPGALIAAQDTFESQNEHFGAQGGLEEVSLGISPIGQTDQTSGLFLREQRPADGDNTQGGYESVLDPNVTSIQWEFFDGMNWLTDWDTRAMQRRIPAAVRVTYQLQDEDDPHTFVVRLKKSDVTIDNPAGLSSTAGGTGA
jgi:prepilin-type N-terminal cleavage/methylation domain-containing protein